MTKRLIAHAKSELTGPQLFAQFAALKSASLARAHLVANDECFSEKGIALKGLSN